MPWRIDTTEPLTEEVRTAIRACVERYDRTWSRFRDDSLVARIATAPGAWSLPSEAVPLLAWYRELSAATQGRVTPLARALEPAERFEDALAWDGETLSTARPLALDIAAAGKGLLVDLVVEILESAGLDRYVVDASGDLRARGLTEWRIALEHPGDARRAVGIAEPGDRALCASAAAQRDGTRHVIDALTGLPVAEVVATWAVADTAMVADGAATALFFDVDRELLRRHRIDHARLYRDGRVDVSPGFPGTVLAAKEAPIDRTRG